MSEIAEADAEVGAVVVASVELVAIGRSPPAPAPVLVLSLPLGAVVAVAVVVVDDMALFVVAISVEAGVGSTLAVGIPAAIAAVEGTAPNDKGHFSGSSQGKRYVSAGTCAGMCVVL